MIHNDEQLAVVQNQLARVESIVESWSKKLLPHNPKNFAIYAEGALDEAEKLKAEIAEYTQRRNPVVPETATPQPASERHPTNAT